MPVVRQKSRSARNYKKNVAAISGISRTQNARRATSRVTNRSISQVTGRVVGAEVAVGRAVTQTSIAITPFTAGQTETKARPEARLPRKLVELLMDLRKWEIPRSVNYIGQMVIIFAVTCTSLYKLCTCHDNEQLWIALLCSSLGYTLPSPKIFKKYTQQSNE